MATETTTAAQSNAEVALAWIQRGLRLREQKQWSEALESFEKALALDPRSAQGWALKGRVLDEMNNLSEAIRCYKTSLDLNPNSASTWNNKGYAFRKQQKYSLALECYREAVRLQPNYAKAWYNMGYVLDKSGNYEDALNAFTRAIELQPDNEKYVASRAAVHATWLEFQKVFDTSAALQSSKEPKETSPNLQRCSTTAMSAPLPHREKGSARNTSTASDAPPVRELTPNEPAQGTASGFNPFLEFETPRDESSSSYTSSMHGLSRPHTPPGGAGSSDSSTTSPKEYSSSHVGSSSASFQEPVISLNRHSLDESSLHFSNPTNVSANSQHLRHASASMSISTPNLVVAAHGNSQHPERHHSAGERVRGERRRSQEQVVYMERNTTPRGGNAVSDESQGYGSSANDTPTISQSRSSSVAPQASTRSSRVNTGSSSTSSSSSIHHPPIERHSLPEKGELRPHVEGKDEDPNDTLSLLNTMQHSLQMASLASSLPLAAHPKSTSGGAAAASPDGSDGEPDLVHVGPRAQNYLDAIYTHLQNIKTVRDAEKLEGALEEMLAAIRVKRAFLATKTTSSNAPQDKCACCWERPPEMVCIPCGHLCICEDCKSKLRQKKCPICGQAVKNIYKVFK